MKKLLIATCYGVLTLMSIWGVFSYLEVLCKNLSPNPQYSALNLFTLFI